MTVQQERRTSIRAVIVDDCETILDFMSRALNSSQGIEVIASVGNGAEAVETADEMLPDVVVMDVEMPILDGLEATRCIKLAHPEIVVILVSGSADFPAASVAAGADGFLTKPFGADLLVCTVLDVFFEKEDSA